MTISSIQSESPLLSGSIDRITSTPPPLPCPNLSQEGSEPSLFHCPSPELPILISGTDVKEREVRLAQEPLSQDGQLARKILSDCAHAFLRNYLYGTPAADPLDRFRLRVLLSLKLEPQDYIRLQAATVTYVVHNNSLTQELSLKIVPFILKAFPEATDICGFDYESLKKLVVLASGIAQPPL